MQPNCLRAPHAALTSNHLLCTPHAIPEHNPRHRRGAQCDRQDQQRHRAEELAHGFGALVCRVRTATPGRVVLELVRRDALADHIEKHLDVEGLLALAR